MNIQAFIPWLKGLLAAFIGAAANGVTASAIAPESFNLGAQWKNTLMFAGASGVFAAAGYLKKSPLPEMKTNEEIK